MYDINLRRIYFTSDADVTLKMMRARTGLLANILCRLALCVSLDEPGVPRLVTDDDRSAREINRFTLFGEYDATFVALAKARLHEDSVEADQANAYLVAHIHRGISLLPNRVKTLSDLAELIPSITSRSDHSAEVLA